MFQYLFTNEAVVKDSFPQNDFGAFRMTFSHVAVIVDNG